ncbi:hypothetical protein M8J77_008468 [Diaphorina citri]|nr:hypothetical protein M8J77_008468 [Diaphorina citri]
MGRGKRSKLLRTVLEEEKGTSEGGEGGESGKVEGKGIDDEGKMESFRRHNFTLHLVSLPAELKSCMQSFGGIGVSKGSPQEDRLRTQPYLCILSIFQYYLLTFRVQLDRQILSIQKRAVKYLYSNY